MVASNLLSIALFASLAVSQRLTKPPLQDNLDNLRQGLMENLPSVPHSSSDYEEGQIPKDCKDIAQGEGQNPSDYDVRRVKYDDCDTPWVICFHRQSNGKFEDLTDRFGRLPVGTRQFVRHVITVPKPENPFAYNLNGNIAFFGTVLDDLNVHVHEAAHSLDLLGAYAIKPLSDSEKWISEYDQDSAVPDPYAQTNHVEDVAQNTVVTTYERNVPGGLANIPSDWNKLFRQFATVDTQQREAGNLVVKGGQCTDRLQSSPPVPKEGGLRARGVVGKLHPADILPRDVNIIKDVEFDAREACLDGAF